MLDRVTRRRFFTALAGLPAAAAWPGIRTVSAREATTMNTGGATSMLARPIGRTGESVPVIGIGSSNTFDVGATPAERAPLLDVLRELSSAGGTVVDTSPMYGRSEGVLGDLIEELALRPKLWIATKVWTKGREAGEQQIGASMRELRVKRLELLQIHNLLDWQVHMPTLRALREQGKLKYLGEREAENRLLPFCRDRGIAVMVNRPFADGAMFQRVRDKPLPSIAKELGIASWGQYFLKWIVGHPAVTCVIPATSKPKHMLDNSRAGFGPVPDARQREVMAQAW
jgi:diketogulonate reductase-like aldo/keto reductase